MSYFQIGYLLVFIIWLVIFIFFRGKLAGFIKSHSDDHGDVLISILVLTAANGIFWLTWPVAIFPVIFLLITINKFSENENDF